MPSGDAPRLTISRVALDRARRLLLLALRAARFQGPPSRELAEDIAALRSAAELSLAVLP